MFKFFSFPIRDLILALKGSSKREKINNERKENTTIEINNLNDKIKITILQVSHSLTFHLRI